MTCTAGEPGGALPQVVAAYAPRLDPPDVHAPLEAPDGAVWRLVE